MMASCCRNGFRNILVDLQEAGLVQIMPKIAPGTPGKWKQTKSPAFLLFCLVAVKEIETIKHVKI